MTETQLDDYYQKIQALPPARRRLLDQKLTDWLSSNAAAPAGPKSLALFYVAKDELPSHEVRAFLEQRLPDYMLPGEYVRLEAIPKTVHGKLDRDALKKHRRCTDLNTAKAAPMTETQRRLAQIWSGVLNVPSVGADDNFFERGGHSLLATQVIMEVEQAFGLTVPLSAMFAHPSVAQLARYLETAARPLSRAARAVPPDEEVPLSNAQRRLWYASQLSDGGLEYKIVKVLELEGVFDVPAFGQALDEVVRRHETLRTCFRYVSGRLVQKVTDAPASPQHVDLSALPHAVADGAYTTIEREVLGRPFDLENGPLLRVTLLKYGDTRARVIFDVHHIVIDGWSFGILIQELNSLVQSFSRGLPSTLAPLTAQYRDYTVWERQRLDAAGLEAQMAYWRPRLKGAPRLEFRNVRSEAAGSADGEVDFEIDGVLSREIDEASRRLKATPFAFLTSAYYVLLHRHTGALDISIGTDVANRDTKDHAGLIGFFVNQLVLRLQATDGLSFRELCLRTRNCVEEAFAHKDVPYDAVMRELRTSSSSTRDSLFRTKLVLHRENPAVALEGIRTRAIEPKSSMTKVDLLFNLEQHKEGLRGKAEYSGRVFDASSIGRLIDDFKRLCGHAVQDVDATVKTLAEGLAGADLETSRRHLESVRGARGRDLRALLLSQEG